MNKAEKQKIIGELRDLYKKLKSYNRYLRSENISEAQKRYMESLREGVVRKSGVLKKTISELTGKFYYTQFGQTQEIWANGLNPSGFLPSKLTGLGFCIDATNEAIGILESTPPVELEAQGETKKAVEESPLKIFDAICLHTKVVEASESLFKTGNYASAIFEAFKAVHNYVQDKTGLILDGANLMEKVFSENKPILQLNELLTPSDKNEQKGFKHIFMGSQIGIRNPKAHENVKQEDPTRTLEYLSIASLLMRRIDESKLVKLNI